MIHSVRKKQSNTANRRGFTLMEVMVVAGLMSLLLMMFSAAWRGFAQPTSISIRRARLIREASLLVEGLSRDVGGSLGENQLGEKQSGKLVGHYVTGNTLRLCFDGFPNDGAANWALPDTVVTWRLVGERIVRTNAISGSAITVAESVSSFSVVNLGTSVQIATKFSDGNQTRDLTLRAVMP